MSNSEPSIGHRYLIKFKDIFINNLTEVRVLEISKKKHIKLSVLRSDGEEYIDWDKLDNIEFVEDLGIATELKE